MSVHALLVGCEYRGKSHYLPGCIYDVNKMESFLTQRYPDLPKENITIMTDIQGEKPTKSAILHNLRELVKKGDVEGSTLIFHFSGHGSQVPDLDGDEIDHMDECLIPLGNVYSLFDVIIDDELHEIVKKLSLKSKMFILTDCCHSGSCFDLEYAYKTQLELAQESTQESTQLPNIVKLSGCKDNQTSASIKHANKWKGALTLAFIDTLSRHGKKTWEEMFRDVTLYIGAMKLTQKPVLSCNKPGYPGDIFI
tara:strand:- start:368 stop:1123 length:756 start_codon:yes stop_codon:yes gene_type:complete